VWGGQDAAGILAWTRRRTTDLFTRNFTRYRPLPVWYVYGSLTSGWPRLGAGISFARKRRPLATARVF
jgi:hypothetical protein